MNNDDKEVQYFKGMRDSLGCVIVAILLGFVTALLMGWL